MEQINSNIPFEELPFHLGIKDNDVVFISSDVSNFALKAKADGTIINVDSFINNFQSILKNGTLIIPAYTDYLKDGDTFDYLKSKPSTGAISNKTFKRKDFQRTTDVLHSVFVWGKDSNEILQLKDESTFGKNSIFSYLHQVDCTFLFFDVNLLSSFTYIHYVEEYSNVHYRKYKHWKITFKRNDELVDKKVLFHTRKKGVFTNVEKLIKALFDQNKMTRYQYDTINIDKLKAKNAAQTIESLIQNKDYLYTFSNKEYFKATLKDILIKLRLYKK